MSLTWRAQAYVDEKDGLYASTNNSQENEVPFVDWISTLSKKDVDWIIASLSNSAFNSYHLFLSQPQQTLMQLRAWFLNKDYPLSWTAEKI